MHIILNWYWTKTKLRLVYRSPEPFEIGPEGLQAEALIGARDDALTLSLRLEKPNRLSAVETFRVQNVGQSVLSGLISMTARWPVLP